MDFKSLGVKANYVKALKEMNILEPTPIQKEVLPILFSQSRDMIAQAQTGTGKTLAFGLPVLESVNLEKKKIQALILAPTRELGQQIAKQLFKFTKYNSDKIFTECVYGGEKIELQESRLSRTTHVLVATPGRLIELMQKGKVSLVHVKTIVLDEADEMLSMGFQKDLEKILESIPGAQCRWLFSATMPHKVIEISRKYLSPAAHKIEIGLNKVVNPNIQHQYIECVEEEKLNVLTQFLKTQKKGRGVIFCRTKKASDKLAKQLKAKNFATELINGDLTQKERDKVMRAFKNESLQYLIATDLAARGIDVPNLSFVVHYEQPDQDEYYTHRSGRTARAGKTGVSLNIVSGKEVKQIRYYEKLFGLNFIEIT